MPLAPGARLGPYEVLGPLGAGGMGEVYRARDTRRRREVAVKVLPESFSQDPDRLRRFEQEALAASALNHPNILTIHDFGSEAGSPYVVSELLEGQTLREALSKGAFPEGKAIEYGVQIANGMAAAHEKGIVHRDLKRDNIFVTRDGLRRARCRRRRGRFLCALIYTGLGEKDHAFEWLERAYQERSTVLAYLRLDPRLAPSRSDPRYSDLVRRIGFPSSS